MKSHVDIHFIDLLHSRCYHNCLENCILDTWMVRQSLKHACYLHPISWLHKVDQIIFKKNSNWPRQLPHWRVFRHLLHNYLLNIFVVAVPILWSHWITCLIFCWKQLWSILGLIFYLILIFIILNISLLCLLDEMITLLKFGLCNWHPCDYSLNFD